MASVRPSTAIVAVAGSGRSGTSLFATLLQRLGAHIPQPEVHANSSNPLGFGEPRWAVEFHESLLARSRVDAQDPRPEAWSLTRGCANGPRPRSQLRSWLSTESLHGPLVVVKDPRLAWFLPLYRSVTADMGARLVVATVVRTPAEAVDSRLRAYGPRFSPTALTAGWINMMLGTEIVSRDLPRAVVTYEGLMGDWVAAFQQVDQRLGLGLVEAASEQQWETAGALIEHRLRRASPQWGDLPVPMVLRELADDTYSAMARMSNLEGGDSAEVRAGLDELRATYDSYVTECGEVLSLSGDVVMRSAMRSTVKRFYLKARRRLPG